MLRSLVRFLLIVPVGRSLPLIAGQLSADVRWSTADFVTAAALLSGGAVALTIDTATPPLHRWRFSGAIGAVVIIGMVWLELAVGVFGTPWAGS